MPKTIKDIGMNLKELEKRITNMAMNALSNQSTGTNPCMPLIADIEKILWEAYGSRQ
ncbi:MAG TPA: hypothetical protein HPP56_07630 [Nitrospirae bacterium]|nr:hypothetical protein [Nitrospirota bacterium]